MKWILIPLLWLLAMAVAVLVLLRWWRGRNIMLRGRWSPRFIRMVAVVLVMLGVAGEKSDSAPAPGVDDKQGKKQPADELPAAITAANIEKWLTLQQTTGEWAQVKQGYVKISLTPGHPDDNALRVVQAAANRLFPEKFRELFLADLDAVATGKRTPAVRGENVMAAIDQLEHNGCFDHWINAFLWRKTARVVESEPRQLVQVYARLHRHARLTNTLIAARSQVRPLLQGGRPWMSKAAPPPGWQRGVVEIDLKQAAAEMIKIVPKQYGVADLGNWQRDGFTQFNVAGNSGPVTVIRAGQGQVPVENRAVTFGRLDLLETLADGKPVILEHAWLGQLHLPAGRTISVWDLPGQLSADGKSKLQETVAQAMNGKEDAASRLERTLPLAHAAIREALARSPSANGAPRLRLILSLFDDVVMPSGEANPFIEEDLPARRVPRRVID